LTNIRANLELSSCSTASRSALLGNAHKFKPDQGSQFTSQAFTQVPKEKGILISMDSKGSLRDNLSVD